MTRFAALYCKLIPGLSLGLIAATMFLLPTYAATPAATTTTLTITESGQSVSTVAQGSLLTLTATVTSGTGAVTPGQVNFCDANGASCSDIHFLGTAQLTSTGTAVMKMRASPGQHSYKAVFLGALNAPTPVQTSSSAPWSLFVQPSSISTTSVLSATGTDPYTMTCKVSGTAPNSVAGPTGTVTFTDLQTNGVLGTATLGSPAQTRSLLGYVNYTTGAGPVAVVYGDFNGDGVLDLAVPSQPDNTLSILLGNPDGTFQAQRTYTVSSYPLGVAVGDFNNDGKLDLAVTNYTVNTVTILLGNGDGTFTKFATAPATGSGPAEVVDGDFNGDGKLDLAVTNAGAGTVSVLLGNGDGTFQAQKSYAVGTQPLDIVAGLFRGNGQPLDLVVANYGGESLSVLQGNGDGTFQTQKVLTSGIGASPNITAGDFNGDGILDIGAAGGAGGFWWTTVQLGNGDDTFRSSPVPVPNTVLYPSRITATDLNNDGVPDLAIADNHGSTVLLLYGNGDGTMTVGPSYPVGTTPYAIGAGDFNGDGLADLAVANEQGNVSILLENVSTSASATIQSVTLIAGAKPTHALQCNYAGDVNYAASVSNQITETIAPATPIVVVDSASTPFGPGALRLAAYVEFTRSVVPTGAVTIQVDSGPSLTASCRAASPLTQFCTVTYPTGTLSGGSHTILATVASDANYKSNSGTSILTVTKLSPMLVVWPISTTYGSASTTLPAYLEYAPGLTIFPTGAVTLWVDSGPSLTATCRGTAFPLICSVSYPTATLSVGTHTISGTLAADVNYNGASGSRTLTITKATPILVVSPISITYGTKSANLATYVESIGSIAPSGAVTLQVDSGASVTASCKGVVSSSTRFCTVSYPTATLPAGSHTITATVASDANYNATSKAGTLTITQATPILAVTPSSITYGTKSANLATNVQYAGALAPAGAVTIQVDSGSALAASCKAASASTLSCTVSYPTGPLALGSHTITATVASDTNYTAASKTGVLTITQATPILVVSPISIAYGTKTTTLATYVEYSGVLAPAGAVTLQVDSGPALTASCRAASSSTLFCTVSYTTGTLILGSHTITAAVGSDANYTAASKTGTLTITQATPVLVVSPRSITYGTKSVNLATYVEYSGAIAPTGSVSLQVDSGASLPASCSASSSSMLFCSVSYATGTLPTGSHTITATVASDTNYTAASKTGALTITQATPILVVSPRSITFGTNPTTLAAYVEFSGTVAPTGAVTLQVASGSALTASCKAASSATLFCTVSYATGTLPVGSHTITASVVSDANYYAASKTGTLTVTQ